MGFLWEQMFCAQAGEEEHACRWGGMAGSEVALALRVLAATVCLTRGNAATVCIHRLCW